MSRSAWARGQARGRRAALAHVVVVILGGVWGHTVGLAGSDEPRGMCRERAAWAAAIVVVRHAKDGLAEGIFRQS